MTALCRWLLWLAAMLVLFGVLVGAFVLGQHKRCNRLTPGTWQHDYYCTPQ